MDFNSAFRLFKFVHYIGFSRLEFIIHIISEPVKKFDRISGGSAVLTQGFLYGYFKRLQKRIVIQGLADRSKGRIIVKGLNRAVRITLQSGPLICKRTDHSSSFRFSIAQLLTGRGI